MEYDEESSFARMQRLFRDDARHSEKWRKDARRWQAFAAGHQWSAEDMAILEEQGRPAITFNVVVSILRLVAGLHENDRKEVIYKPIVYDAEPARINEALTLVSRTMANVAEVKKEDARAFMDLLRVGMAWVETRLNYEKDHRGQYEEKRVDPLEMYWDHTARETNLTDAERIWRVRRLSVEKAKSIFPGFTSEQLDASWAGQWRDDPTLSGELRTDFTRNSGSRQYVTIVQAQWVEREPYWLVTDPATGVPKQISEADYEILSERAKALGTTLEGVRLNRLRYMQQFFGSEPLTEAEPTPTGIGFTFHCVTGEDDPEEGTWYGLVKLLWDPQMWSNKWLAQLLHLMNSLAKGGILAERDAFEDQRQAEETYAQPNAITFVRPGAISGQKIMAKPGGVIPSGYEYLVQYAGDSVWRVSGLSPEIMGLAQTNQPGILEEMRQRSSLTILAPMFANWTFLDRARGRDRLSYMQKYLADGRFIRVAPFSVLDPSGQPLKLSADNDLIRLTSDVVDGEYEIDIVPAPNSPDMQIRAWAAIQTMLPLLGKNLTPPLMATIMEFVPGIPVTLITKLREALSEQDPMQQVKDNLQMAGAQAEVALTQARAKREEATAMEKVRNVMHPPMPPPVPKAVPPQG